MIISNRNQLIKQFFLLMAFTSILHDQVIANKEFDHITSLVLSINCGIHSYPEENLEFIATMRILKQGDSFFAVSENESYCGLEKEESWKHELTQSDLKKLHQFLTTLETQPFEPDEPSFNNDTYTLTYQNKTHKVSQAYIFRTKTLKSETDINLPFLQANRKEFILNFYQNLFENQLAELVQKRMTNKARIDQLISRTWYFEPKSHDGLKRHDVIVFSATPTEESSAYWRIDKDCGFTHSEPSMDQNNAKINIEYDLHSYNKEHIYLSVFDVKDLVERTDLEPWEQTTSFYILVLSEGEMRLQIAY